MQGCARTGRRKLPLLRHRQPTPYTATSPPCRSVADFAKAVNAHGQGFGHRPNRQRRHGLYRAGLLRYICERRIRGKPTTTTKDESEKRGGTGGGLYCEDGGCSPLARCSQIYRIAGKSARSVPPCGRLLRKPCVYACQHRVLNATNEQWYGAAKRPTPP